MALSSSDGYAIMLREHPATGSLASFLSLTVTASPLAALSLPPPDQLSIEEPQSTPIRLENIGTLRPPSRISVAEAQAGGVFLPPHLEKFGQMMPPSPPTQTERSPLESLKPPPILSLFTVSAQSNPISGGSPRHFVGMASTASSALSLTAGIALPSIQPSTIPLHELDSWIQFGEIQSPWLERHKASRMNWLQQLGATIQQTFHRDPAVELSRRAIMSIQSTPEGREVLGQLRDEYGRTGRKLIIAAADFRGSTIVRNNGGETIIGIRGQANPAEGIYLFNREFLKFRDPDIALEFLCGNMSHEMRHLVSRSQVERLSGPGGAAFSHAFIDEQRARITGYLVAARLNKGKPTDYSDEARQWATNPKAFWAELNSWPIYAHNLETDEFRDPIRAFTKRIMMLQKAIKENDANISEHLPRIGAQLDVLEQKEGLKGQLKEVRSIYEGLLANEPGERAANKQMLYLIRELRHKLSSPDGKALLTSYQSAPNDPAFRLLQQGLERDEQTLRSLMQTKQLPRFTPKRGQLTWDEFKERVRTSQREHPEFWVEHRARFPLQK
jgi:hypothetical protein